MRQTIIEVIGFLIYELVNNDEADAKQTQEEISQLFLLERVLDLYEPKVLQYLPSLPI
jgi:hypothetical protein